MLFCFASCNMNKPDQETGYILVDAEEEIEEEPKVAEKKSALFYQKLLERFCQMYYKGCFDRTYLYNSLVVDDVSVIQGNWEGKDIVSWNMLVKGIHSFEGTLKNYNDISFYAFVDDLGDNSYKVTFFAKKYGLLGESDEEESATRTISYSE